MMKLPKLRELKEAIVSLITFPYTTKFPKKPHTPFKGFRGKPVVDDDLCVGCEACASVCPTGCIQIIDDAKKRVRIIERNYGYCIFCGQCETNCITEPKAVKLSDEIYDMAVFNKKELIEKQKKELVVCERCGTIIGSKQHLQYIYSKLGPYAFSQLSLVTLLHQNLKIVKNDDINLPIKDKKIKRKDSFSILCPNCKRKVLIKSLV